MREYVGSMLDHQIVIVVSDVALHYDPQTNRLQILDKRRAELLSNLLLLSKLAVTVSTSCIRSRGNQTPSCMSAVNLSDYVMETAVK